MHEERVWTARLRWRWRGAVLWPAFAALTLLDGLLLHHNPIAGDSTAIVPGVLLAGFLNLGAVAVLAPLASRRLRGGRPREVADDAAGTIVVVGVTVVLAALGLAHAAAVGAADRAMADQLAAARTYFAHQAPPEFRRHLGAMSTWKQSDDLFRTCISNDAGDRALCVFVTTAQSPPGVRLDPDRRPNSVIAGPDNPGRS